VAERFIAAACKAAVLRGIGGSNPSRRTQALVVQRTARRVPDPQAAGSTPAGSTIGQAALVREGLMSWFDSRRKRHVAYLTGVGGSPQNCRSRFNPGTRLHFAGAHAMDKQPGRSGGVDGIEVRLNKGGGPHADYLGADETDSLGGLPEVGCLTGGSGPGLRCAACGLHRVDFCPSFEAA
jgi:hypothetical protein